MLSHSSKLVRLCDLEEEITEVVDNVCHYTHIEGVKVRHEPVMQGLGDSLEQDEELPYLIDAVFTVGSLDSMLVPAYTCVAKGYPDLDPFILDSGVFKPTVRSYKVEDLVITGMVKKYKGYFTINHYVGVVDVSKSDDNKDKEGSNDVPFFVDENRIPEILGAQKYLQSKPPH